MAKKLMTEATKLKLIEFTANEIEKRSKSLDKSKHLVDFIQKTQDLAGLTVVELEDISKILEFKILIGFISLDLTTCVRAYLRADFQYEGQYFLRQFTVVINEGYKKIYNFKKINPDGTENLGNRSRSFWVKDIGHMVNRRDSKKLSESFSNITNGLDSYLEQNFEGIKENRDISVHYDSDLKRVYETITSLRSEILINTHFIPFYELLDSIFFFSHELLMAYGINRIEHPN